MACSLQGEKQTFFFLKMWTVCGVKLEVFSSVKKESTCCSASFTLDPVFICLHCVFSALLKFFNWSCQNVHNTIRKPLYPFLFIEGSAKFKIFSSVRCSHSKQTPVPSRVNFYKSYTQHNTVQH